MGSSGNGLSSLMAIASTTVDPVKATLHSFEQYATVYHHSMAQYDTLYQPITLQAWHSFEQYDKVSYQTMYML